jgi:hypothetical protein
MLRPTVFKVSDTLFKKCIGHCPKLRFSTSPINMINNMNFGVSGTLSRTPCFLSRHGVGWKFFMLLPVLIHRNDFLAVGFINYS